MMEAKFTDEEIKCPECKKTAIELVAPRDSGKGRKICRDCKRRSKKKRRGYGSKL